MLLTNNLQGYWKLDETGGTRADSTANGNILTDNNTVLYGTGANAKIVNSAYLVRASAQYLSRANASLVGLNLSATDFTMNLWAKFVSVPSLAGEEYVFIAKEKVNEYQYNFSYYYTGGSAKLALGIGNGTVSDSIVLVAWTPDLDTWYMITVTYTNATRKVDFYINASPQGAQQTVGYNVGAGTGDFDIGEAFSTGYNGYFDGYLDEVGVWDRLLLTSEITTLYNSGTGLTYPFSSHPFSPFPSHYNT